VAEIEWKGAFWKAAYGELSVRDLLTILKGFGPMEILEFNKPETCQGQISLCISEAGSKEITIHNLAIRGDRRKGHGRKTLQWLKRVFKGEIYVDYPEFSSAEEASQGSLPFWIKMYREGLIDSLECDTFCLYPAMGEAELLKFENDTRNILHSGTITSGSHDGQR
jgi:hypothetical protein